MSKSGSGNDNNSKAISKIKNLVLHLVYIVVTVLAINKT